MYISYGYKDKVLRVPNGSFFKGEGEYNVFVMDGDNRLVKRRIKTGDSNREYVEVLEGLRPGDRIVTNDLEKYKNKSKLKIKK